MELADESVKQGGEFEAQLANDTIPLIQAPVEFKVGSLSAYSEQAREEGANVKAELDGLRAKAELSTEELNVALT